MSTDSFSLYARQTVLTRNPRGTIPLQADKMQRLNIKPTFSSLNKETFGSKTFKGQGLATRLLSSCPLSVHMIPRGFFSQVPEYFWTLPAIAAATWGSECYSSAL